MPGEIWSTFGAARRARPTSASALEKLRFGIVRCSGKRLFGLRHNRSDARRRHPVRRTKSRAQVRVAREAQVLCQAAQIILAIQHSLGGERDANGRQTSMDRGATRRAKSAREVIRRAANFTAEGREGPAPAGICGELQFDVFGPSLCASLCRGATCLTRDSGAVRTSSQRIAQKCERSFFYFKCGGTARFQTWQSPSCEKVGCGRSHRRAYPVERRAVVNVAAINAFKRFLQHFWCETQARALVPISNRVAHAVLASRCEEKNSSGVRDDSLFPHMLDEHTAVRDHDVMIGCRFGSPAPGLVRAAADARDLD